ncbi:hypothetical protein ABW21_db0206002 [Orbilia brochopaga]|nr:hypothetical protein ABW21_db0206002 [Drechslerella brochopaga]
MSSSSHSTAAEPLAIIGFSFRFPSGIESSDSFWKMMMEGDTGLAEVPEDRLNLQAFLDIDGGRGGKKPKGYFMTSDIGAFDAPFFSITAEEAMAMDPQQRLLLETTYHALENAGVPMNQVNGTKTSVHVGCLSYDYRLALSRDAESATKYSVTGSEVSILANRLSWYFNLKGPSLAVETACSSSLVALDMASQLLRNKETDMAVIAGTSLTLLPDLFLYLDNMGFLSPDSRCHSFDSRANGYARSEGLGVVLVKRLSDAIRDKNTIRAVIRSTGSNQDGHTPGITQPSSQSQLALIRDTYRKAGLSMEPTRFCEAHGTGTLLGDPIESNAIGTAFRSTRAEDDPLYIGASKANVGHLEAASGIVGIIKSILILERGVIPPIADLVELNSNIDDAYYKLKFPTKATPWPGDGLRRASINSFGFGGTNAHVVLDDARGFLRENGLEGKANYITASPTLVANAEVVHQTTRPYLLTFSAADRGGIQRLGSTYGAYFAGSDSKDDPEVYNRLAFTLNNKRSSLPWKSYAVVKSPESLVNIANELSVPIRPPGRESKLAFVFTGQGAQWARMGIELMYYPVFAQSVQRSSDYLRAIGCPWDLQEEMERDASTSQMNNPDIRPSVVLGHSSGEVAAAYCKGAISQESAIKVAYFRGMGGAAASKDTTKRTMMSVGLSETEAIDIIQEMSAIGHDDIHIACINSPSNVTLAGSDTHLDALKVIMDQKATFCRKLKVSCAYHSPHMIPIANEYFSRAGRIEPRYSSDSSKSIPMISYLDGNVVSNERLLELDYWITNMCSAVRFTDDIVGIDRLAALAANGRKRLDLSHRKGLVVTNILEIGPHSALKGPIREIMQKTFKFARDIQYDSALVRGTSGLDSILRAAGSLHCAGFTPDISYLNSDGSDKTLEVAPLTDLPPYPFAHNRSYWSESRRTKSERLRSHRPNELLGNPSPDWHPLSATWRNFLNKSKSGWIEDHSINDAVLYPGSGMLTMAIEAMKQYAQDTLGVKSAAFSLKHIEFLSAIQIPEGSMDLEVQVHLKPLDEGAPKLGWFEFEVFASDNDQWKKSCKGLIQAEAEGRCNAPPLPIKLDALALEETGSTLSHEEGIFTPLSPDAPTIFSDNESTATLSSTAGSAPQSPSKEFAQFIGLSIAESPLALEHSSEASGLVELPTEKFFARLREAGYMYGPTFQRINRIQFSGPSEVQAVIDAYEEIEGHHGHGTRAVDHASVVHPATLDAFFQLPLANIIKDHATMPTMIPSKLKSMWISSEGLNEKAMPLFATAWHNFSGYRGSEHTVFVEDSRGDVKLHLTGYEMTRVSGGPSELEELSPNDLQHCWKFKWDPIAASQKSEVANDTRLVEVHLYKPCSTTVDLANALKASFEKEPGIACNIVRTTSANASTSADLKIILWDVDQMSILAGLNEDVLSMVQKTLQTNNVLWIQTSDMTSQEYSSQHLVDGLSRVVRQENSMASFATLSLSSTSAQIAARAQAISQVCGIIFTETDSLNLPQRFRETQKGAIEHVRLTEAAELTRKVQSVRLASVPTEVVWGDLPLRITVGSPGVLDTIHFVEDDQGATLHENEVEVEVKAAGVNFKDCLIALGALNENKIGSEIAGIVTRIGLDCEGHGLRPGDPIVGFTADGYRTFYRTTGSSLSRIPASASLSFAEAASIPVNFATAWHALRYVARLEAGEKVLIHSGAGGTGQAAIQIAQYLGATVFTTVSTQEKRDLLTARYNIPPSHIFSSRNTDFVDGIMSMVGGVDVVLNSLSGDVLFGSWECILPFGRFVEIGKKDIQSHGKLPMAQFEKNISFSAVDLGHMHEKRPEYVARMVDEVIALFQASGGLRTVSELTRFSVSEVVEAFRLIGSGKTTGKIVIEMTPESKVPAVLALPQLTTLSPDASYVIAGGLGGLGRVAARWMAERGAKNLILLSRSGPRTLEMKAFVAELESMGVNCFTPACDISNRSMVEKVFQSLNCPPIKGCLQSSMVLRSALFTDMTHKEWTEATSCKIEGSWNLHEILPKNLDFFILLSSVQAILGARTQANYNAGNTYMDGLALHRVSTGLKAVSIMLAVVSSDGYLAEKDHADEKELLLAQNTYHDIQAPDFHALLDYYCNGDMPILPVEDAQVTLGIKLLHEDPDLDPLGTIWGRDPIFQALRLLKETDSTAGAKGSKGSAKKDVAGMIAAAKSVDEAAQIVRGALTARLASTIAGMDPDEMDQSKPIQAYGVDSLQTMELRSWFLRYFRADLPTFSILGAPSLAALANSVAERSTLRAK